MLVIRAKCYGTDAAYRDLQKFNDAAPKVVVTRRSLREPL
jgi:hypothetical protein